MIIRLFTLLLFSSAVARAQTYAVDWHTIDGGGGTSTGGICAVSGTIGQPDAISTPLTNGPYVVVAGFWVLPVAVQTEGGPVLSIAPSTPGFATISWTPGTPGFVLQENTDLTTTNWVNSASGAANPVTVPAAAPKKYYRLRNP